MAFAAVDYFGQETAGTSDKEESNGSQETYFAQDLFSGKLKANISKRDKVRHMLTLHISILIK